MEDSKEEIRENIEIENEDVPLYYVGIGASAGGLEAIEEFFNNMPEESGFSFIIVQHLSPDYKSLMRELLSKHTKMPIYIAKEGMKVVKNSVYLIPPGRNLKIFHGNLLLSEQEQNRGFNFPIDIFLCSLAEDKGERAIGIILSGTGSDGTKGIKSIKEFAGITIVQSEDTARFDGMPRSAISTGMADFILSPAEMPTQLLTFINYPNYTKIKFTDKVTINEEQILINRIFALLREKHKVDFTFYKQGTVVRRIERRMMVNQISELASYVKLIETYPREINQLYQDLLIGVTSFFRDPEVFKIIEENLIDNLFKRDGIKEFRFWIAGCSTGEEVYSLAMLCFECMERIGKKVDIKIFATDLDSNAIMQASNGVYKENIRSDVPQYLLNKYFVPRNDDCFQISSKIREVVVFATHNLLKDPPFTNIHLISCRNLLIYFQPVLQKKVFEFFNFSLVPSGLLVLGTSESINEMAEYFEIIDHKWKIFQTTGLKNKMIPNNSLFFSLKQAKTPVNYPPTGGNLFRPDDRLLEKILQTIANQYLICALIINENMELLHIIGNSEGLLQWPTGKVVNDISKIVLKELSIPLSNGIQKVAKTGTNISYSNIHIHRKDQDHIYQVQIQLLSDKPQQNSLYIVIIDENSPRALVQGAETQSYDAPQAVEQRISQLEQELQFSRESLQATIEELETSNEELQATNEELLSSNEELQSTNEELQSVNEELHTINSEYQQKIIELTELNNDIDNLLSSNPIATIFLDENFEIRRFTPSTTKIFYLTDLDLGRPLIHISNNLVDVNWFEYARSVQTSSISIENEVQTISGHCYIMKILPYSIAPKTFFGVTMSFIDITSRKLAENRIKFQANLLECVEHAIIATKLDGTILYWNRFAESMYGWRSYEVLGKNISQNIFLNQSDLYDNYISTILKDKKSQKFVYQVKRKDDSKITVSMTESTIYSEAGEFIGIIGVSTEI